MRDPDLEATRGEDVEMTPSEGASAHEGGAERDETVAGVQTQRGAPSPRQQPGSCHT